jgi:hypothetical protein
MKNLTKTDESKAMRALESAVKLANDGMTPSDALAKAAEDAKLPPQLTQRLVEAFNTSKTLSHYKKAGTSDKAKTFPLADPSAVLEAIYPDAPESVQTKAAGSLHPDYWIGNAVQKEFAKTAEAELLSTVTTPPAPYERDPAAFAKSALDFRSRLAVSLKQVEESQREYAYRTMGEMDKLAAYWRQLTPTEPFDLVEKRAYACYGKPAVTFMALVHEKGGLDDRRLNVKRAAAEDLGTREMAFPADEEPYFHVASAMLFADTSNQFRKEAAAIRDLMHDHAIENINFLPPTMVEAAIGYAFDKHAKKDMPDFLDQDRPKKVKEVYKALKRDNPEMPAGKKARIASATAKKDKDKDEESEKKASAAPLGGLF